MLINRCKFLANITMVPDNAPDDSNGVNPPTLMISFPTAAGWLCFAMNNAVAMSAVYPDRSKMQVRRCLPFL
jgi:hypothetical protein